MNGVNELIEELSCSSSIYNPLSLFESSDIPLYGFPIIKDSVKLSPHRPNE